MAQMKVESRAVETRPVAIQPPPTATQTVDLHPLQTLVKSTADRVTDITRDGLSSASRVMSSFLEPERKPKDDLLHERKDTRPEKAGIKTERTELDKPQEPTTFFGSILSTLHSAGKAFGTIFETVKEKTEWLWRPVYEFVKPAFEQIRNSFNSIFGSSNPESTDVATTTATLQLGRFGFIPHIEPQSREGQFDPTAYLRQREERESFIKQTSAYWLAIIGAIAAGIAQAKKERAEKHQQEEQTRREQLQRKLEQRDRIVAAYQDLEHTAVLMAYLDPANHQEFPDQTLVAMARTERRAESKRNRAA